jgi:dipeptidase E
MTDASSARTAPDATRLLLLSNSATYGQPYLSHALDALAAHLSGRKRLLFIPYALADHDGYTATVAEAMRPIGIGVEGLYSQPDPASAVGSAGAVFVGGGNTFRLLRTLRRAGLLGPLRDRVLTGLPYVGSSAGTNVACPTIRTTNDMPILDPDGFDALGLIPFQINPHYLDPDPGSTHQGETRAQRLAEFCEENDVPVLAMREGAWLRVNGDAASLHGANGAVLFRHGRQPEELITGTDVSWLLATAPRFTIRG